MRTLLTIPGNLDTQRRGRTVVTVALSLLIINVAALPFIALRPDPLTALLALVFGVVVILGSILLARSGRVQIAGWTLIVLVAVAILLPIILRGGASTLIFYMVLPILIAGVVLRPWQIWLVLFIVVGLLAVSAALLPMAIVSESASITLYTDAFLVLFIVAMISSVSAQSVQSAFTAVLDARRQAELAAQQLEAANNGLEQQVATRTTELRSALTEMEERDQERQRLLEEIAQQNFTIREMSVPILPVTHDTLVMPLIGALDSKRLADIQGQALNTVARLRARTLLIDVTGVPVIDTHVARALLSTIEATQLLGAETKLIGVRPEVAQSIVALGIDLHNVKTAANLESALRTV
jgi:rsbT co-antagonist protein RsbR